MIWMLGIELWSDARAKYILNYETIHTLSSERSFNTICHESF